MSPAVASRRKPKVRPPRPPRKPDYVGDYARKVLRGEIVAGRLVRLACERHERDLVRQRTPALPYWFDRGAAADMVEFFPELLTLESGAPFHLPPWLAFSYGSIFGWKRMSDGLRRYQYGFFETSKGSGKTPSAGGIGLYGLMCDGEPYAEIYSAAFDKGQASIILNDAIRMANASEELTKRLIVDKYNIAHPDSGSFFRAMSSEHRGKSGPRPYYVLADEIHEHRDGRVVNKLTAGFKGRTQPLALLYTNSGSDQTSICWEYHQKSIRVLEQTIADDQWFAYVCQLDPCDKCYGEGYRQPRDGCPDCDDWTDRKTWPKISPALGIVVQEKYLEDAIMAARTVPSEFNLKRRLNFCLWTQTHQIWIPSDLWDACKVESVRSDNLSGLVAAGGLDLSSKIDLSSLVVALRIDDAPLPPGVEPEVVSIEGKDEEGKPLQIPITLNFSIEVIPYYWMPEETLHERVTRERIPYDQWQRDSHLFATSGAVIDHEAIYEFTLNAFRRFKLARLGYDEHDATMLATALRDRGRLGDKVLAVSQGKKLSEAFKLIEVLVRTRRVRHNGHPVLSWNIANSEPHRDRLGALWIEKPSGGGPDGKDDTKRIDGVTALATAVSQLMVLPAKKRSNFRVFAV